MEILAIKLKENRHKGTMVKIGNSLNSICMQMIMCLFFKNELQIPCVLEVVPKFGDLAEPKLNTDKTEMLWLGKDQLLADRLLH